MRIAVFADVHGNSLALEAVLADLGRRGADLLVNLGDCASGPLWPGEATERQMALDAVTIRGNCDRAVATLPPWRQMRARSCRSPSSIGSDSMLTRNTPSSAISSALLQTPAATFSSCMRATRC